MRLEIAADSDDLFLGRQRSVGRILRRSSAGVTMAVPFLPTATAAAAFAVRSAVSQSAPAASASDSAAATVSPAPETSRTLTGSAGTWIASPVAR